jgi:hypothetical protein
MDTGRYDECVKLAEELGKREEGEFAKGPLTCSPRRLC